MNSTFKVMKEDLNLIREVLEGLGEDIGYIADIASKYKSKELTEEKLPEFLYIPSSIILAISFSSSGIRFDSLRIL